MQRRPTVAVIGAGFSGALTALRLLEMKDGPCVRLVERRARFGQGAAYSTTSPQHLLNVRAANMSALPEAPSHFLEWLERNGETDQAHTFVTRACYGDYLQGMLRSVAETARAAGRLMLEADEVVALHRRGGRWRLELDMGRGFEADAVVLALGNLPPHAPPSLTPEAARSPAYAPEPWSLDPAQAPETGTVVLLGTGLTMVDVALT
ncbi:MAG: FAD/NAD(P)-binding protein, partial [Caulobacteraceae bacterium]